MIYPTIFGIDSHARTTTICALVVETGETGTRTFRGNDYEAMARWMEKLPAPAYGVYEAGCTGFVPARLLTGGDVTVVPIAPSKMPTSSESRTRKNDRNDAARLARLALAGELKEVWVPSDEVEGLRDLMHALDDLKDQ
ncbi:MAG: transposase, partial [Coriobacteriales bacterium]|nr:transposase [Coriobacteriales bacterium]